MHVAVVGAGLMGASVAYHLASSGADVTVVDPRQPGQATSGASFAWANASTPEIQDRHYFELCSHAVEEHDVLAASLGGRWLHRTGHLRWADPVSPEDQGALLEHARQLRDRGYQAGEWDPAEVTRQLETGACHPAPGEPGRLLPARGVDRRACTRRPARRGRAAPNRGICDRGVAAIGGYYELVIHLGVTLAALLGRMLAAEIRTGETDDRLAPYRPDRPSLKATDTRPAG